MKKDYCTGSNNWVRAFKNIMEPILNLAYWSEDIEVKDYCATAKIMGRTYVGSGTSVLEALSNLDVKNCKGKCILTVEHGDNRRERVIQPVMSFRLFSLSRMMREIGLKQISQLFSDV